MAHKEVATTEHASRPDHIAAIYIYEVFRDILCIIYNFFFNFTGLNCPQVIEKNCGSTQKKDITAPLMGKTDFPFYLKYLCARYKTFIGGFYGFFMPTALRSELTAPTARAENAPL